MPDLESVIEKRLIDKLCEENSQWTYRPDLRTEEDLWRNFKYILGQNNNAALNGMPLSDSEFAKVKNDVSHASFYDAGKWLVGENGKVLAHIQRGNVPLHLMVMNNEHIAGGTSVYEVISQYQAFLPDAAEGGRDRRFDVTLLINGLPLIHIELKNKDHSYMDGFYQIKKYISEGKFHGIFSNVQMFVVSNAADTKYFSAARDTELDKKFITGWLDKDNHPVCDYLDFAQEVLRIPQAHEMVTKYIVLDNDQKKLLILRPYQIHAIEEMRSASKAGRSGFIWHTTGSGKTMTSYKATRNLLMDIPSIEKTVFLIDRKDLDTQTTMDFQSYAENDTVDVDNTDYVDSLIQRLKSKDRQMIVTTRQKMQIMIDRRLKEGTKTYERIRSLRIAFVVDECHRAVSPQSKRKIENFFSSSLWYGFTGTPIFEENKYDQKGDLPQTTEQLYGKCLHSYTIKEAIHDEAVLGFLVENLGPKNEWTDPAVFESESHMRSVLNVILNQSEAKFGMSNPKGKSYEAILTVRSIARAQKYYELLKKVKDGDDELKIDEEITRAMPDFPKFAITYSLSENEDISQMNQGKMQESLDDYNGMFGTHYQTGEIGAYNTNLNERLARKEKKYLKRDEQLDLVIVVDRLLTGFDAPCLSTLFMDRQPMNPQDIIQAFSRTNRLYDTGKQYGQVVTFQAPNAFKTAINDALTLYSRGGDGKPLSEDWDDVLKSFCISVKAIQALANTPEEIAALSRHQKRAFLRLFRALDHDFAHLKAFSTYNEAILAEHHFSEEQYEDYAAMYKNVLEELKKDLPEPGVEDPVIEDYDLVALHRLRIDFEYLLELLQDVADSIHPAKDSPEDTDFQKKIQTLRGLVAEFSAQNDKLGALLSSVLDEMASDRDRYHGQDISVIVNQMRQEAIDKEIRAYASRWFLDPAVAAYEAYNYRDGVLASENNLKDKADYTSYCKHTENPLPKYKFRKVMADDFKKNLMPEILPLLNAEIR